MGFSWANSPSGWRMVWRCRCPAGLAQPRQPRQLRQLAPYSHQRGLAGSISSTWRQARRPVLPGGRRPLSGSTTSNCTLRSATDRFQFSDGRTECGQFEACVAVIDQVVDALLSGQRNLQRDRRPPGRPARRCCVDHSSRCSASSELDLEPDLGVGRRRATGAARPPAAASRPARRPATCCASADPQLVARRAADQQAVVAGVQLQIAELAGEVAPAGFRSAAARWASSAAVKLHQQLRVQRGGDQQVDAVVDAGRRWRTISRPSSSHIEPGSSASMPSGWGSERSPGSGRSCLPRAARRRRPRRCGPAFSACAMHVPSSGAPAQREATHTSERITADRAARACRAALPGALGPWPTAMFADVPVRPSLVSDSGPSLIPANP